ncbi:hypothetical protein Ade02nite_60570 [Paractinoplanes deccanensis]|uniref:Uncharacterized protein n=1 Tax=Paractinoplanes deccanensis TaxID=113561 RepID=A0ABQ3YBR2_9ACTN|nr:hypothetical protein [Actinoplanes deccanensis]GID77416.1 hypothetical protein Ade02nite_60570 [Actinoplanes deccanensis]
MNVVAEMLVSSPAPAIWATLMLLTLPALLLLGSPQAMRHPRKAALETVAALRERGLQRRRRQEEAARAAQFASEVQVAAERAAASAGRWQEVWEQASAALTTAYGAWLEADARVRTAASAAAWGTPWSVRTCEEYAARERYLHRNVAAAVSRGELPASAMADAVAGRNGWDARLHQVEQELVIARASAAWLRQRYEAAVAAEAAAWHDTSLARRAAGSLRDEAQAAAVRAAAMAPVRGDTEVRARRQVVLFAGNFVQSALR